MRRVGALAATFVAALSVVPMMPATALASECGFASMLGCSPAIRPGSASNACTLNFVVTDGTDLYIGAAGHCTSPGMEVAVPGVGAIGNVVFRELAPFDADWAYVKIKPELHSLVDPTIARFYGPTSSTPVTPEAGDVVWHYGYGASLGQTGPTRGRPGVVVPNSDVLVTGNVFSFIGTVDYGDSGSPVVTADGEPAGMAEAVLLPGPVPNYVVAMRLDSALAAFSGFLGRPVSVVTGDGSLEL